MKDLEYDDASVIYFISRVGTSEVARKFVEELGSDSAIGRMVYVCPNDLGIKKAAFERSRNNDEYTLEVSIYFAKLQVMFGYLLTILLSYSSSSLPRCRLVLKQV
jgi:hypothetical protein